MSPASAADSGGAPLQAKAGSTADAFSSKKRTAPPSYWKARKRREHDGRITKERGRLGASRHLPVCRGLGRPCRRQTAFSQRGPSPVVQTRGRTAPLPGPAGRPGGVAGPDSAGCLAIGPAQDFHPDGRYAHRSLAKQAGGRSQPSGGAVHPSRPRLHAGRQPPAHSRASRRLLSLRGHLFGGLPVDSHPQTPSQPGVRLPPVAFRARGACTNARACSGPAQTP